MSEIANPAGNYYMAAQQVIVELIRAGKFQNKDINDVPSMINKIFAELVDGYEKTYNR